MLEKLNKELNELGIYIIENNFDKDFEESYSVYKDGVQFGALVLPIEGDWAFVEMNAMSQRYELEIKQTHHIVDKATGNHSQKAVIRF